MLGRMQSRKVAGSHFDSAQFVTSGRPVRLLRAPQDESGLPTPPTKRPPAQLITMVPPVWQLMAELIPKIRSLPLRSRDRREVRTELRDVASRLGGRQVAVIGDVGEPPA